MEPISLTTAATAIATIFFTKVIEKPGENLGQLLWDKTQNLIKKLKGESNKIISWLEESQHEQLDYNEAILEDLKTLADKNPELAQAIREVEVEANKESNPQFQKYLQEVRQEADNPRGKKLTIQNLSKLAEKINNLNQAQNITIHQTNTF